jgi:hypothetical protein
VSTPRRNSRPPRLLGLWNHPPADQPIHSDTGSLDSKYSKTSQFSVIRRFIAIESHASESYYHSYTVATSGVHRLASQICHNRLFGKKLQQNILRMISTEVSSLAAHNTWYQPAMDMSTKVHRLLLAPEEVWTGTRRLNPSWRLLLLEVNLPPDVHLFLPT